MSNIIPLVPMTAAQLALLPPEDRAAYWNRVFNCWNRNVEAAKDREYQADHRAARAGNEWCRS